MLFIPTAERKCHLGSFSTLQISPAWDLSCLQEVFGRDIAAKMVYCLLPVSHEWTLTYWLIMYLKKSDTQFLYLCAVHLKYLFSEPKPAFLDGNILAEF